MKYIKLFETFDAEREMSDILGYDVKLFHQVNKLLFLSQEELEDWFEEEIGKDQPNWDLIEILQSQHGIEFNYKDLHWAVEHDKVGLAKYWLDKGIDKDARDSVLRTPLHWAAIYNSEAVAKVLIDAGADKDAQTENLLTPLHFAAIRNSEAVAKLLIDAGADKDAKDKDLQTPLHYAAMDDSGAVAKLLIDAGADKGAKDNKGNTAWDLAGSKLRQSLPELNPDAKQFESENFDAEREMSDILGYDVKLFNQVNKLLFLSQEELEEWFYNEMGKEEPSWDLIQALQSQHDIEFDYKNLHWAAEQNKVGLAKYWLDKGVEMDVMDKYRWTPLHLAAMDDSEAVAKLLLDAGADKNAKDKYLETPLHFAAIHNSKAVAKLLIDAGADKDAQTENLNTPLHLAAMDDSEAVAKLLLDAGADKGAKDVEGNIPWHYASDELCQSLPELNPEVKQFESETFDAEREMSDILGYDVKLFHQVNKLIFLSPEQLQEWFEEEIEKDEPNWDLIEVLQSQHGIEFDYKNLHWAAEHNNIGLAKYLLGKGADKDAQSKILLCTPLHYAAIINSEAVAKLLIDAGADKEAKDKVLRTPLHYAAKYDSKAVAKLLIDAGADKEAKDKVLRTPLHYAAKYDSKAVAKLLIDAGADKDAQGKNLRTPLHQAAIDDNEAVAKLLIDAGADKGSKDKKGRTPWDLAGSKLRQSLPELNPDA
jgi:ankyrin repeat protein